MKRDFDRWEIIYVAVVFIAGLTLRLHLALVTYLNPDEALHALWSFGSWGDVFRNSLQDQHPVLLSVITHAVSRISRSELSIRMVPVLAGSLFPLLLFVWLRRVVGKFAAMAALFLLTLAPHLVTVSAQVRSYTLAFLFLSAALVVLEEALESGRWGMMAGFSVLLWLAMLSDYSMAWFAGAVGVYVLLRLRRTSSSSSSASRALKATWAGGQLVGLALYGLLYMIQLRPFFRQGSTWVGDTWLRGAFPQRGTMLVFPLSNTAKQFAYLMASVPVGGVALALFAVAIFWLWTGRTGLEPSRARALAVLLVLPFALAMTAAYAHQFPYGRSRHTLVAGVFGAMGMAIFVGALPRRAALTLLWAALPLVPLWHAMADEDPQDIGADRNRKEQLQQFLDYFEATVPPGTLIFTDRETLVELAYYEGDNEAPQRAPRGLFVETLVGGRWRLATKDYIYRTPDEYTAALAAFRRQYGLGEREPVWVLDGGWNAPSGPPDEKHPFTKAVRIFQAVGA